MVCAEARNRDENPLAHRMQAHGAEWFERGVKHGAPFDFKIERSS
jgi:hypothetical protein